MASIVQIQNLMREWATLPTLTDYQRYLVEQLRDVADKGDMKEFNAFKDLLCNQFWAEIWQAIVKGREAGLGVKID